jgi:hypothetical protein
LDVRRPDGSGTCGTSISGAVSYEQVATDRGGGINIVIHQRDVHMYQITEHEIDALNESSGYKTLDIALFSMCFGVFIALLITLTTVDITEPRLYASYIGGASLFALGAVFFGIRSFLAGNALKNQIRRIKS